MRRLSILVLVAMVFVTSLAFADDKDAKAKSRALFMQGVAALEAQRTADALALFEKAYALFPHHATLYNIGFSHRQLGHNARAATVFRRYLDEGKGSAPADEAGRVKTLLADLEPKIGTVAITVSPASAKVLLDDEPLTSASAVYVEPGSHKVDATERGLAPGHWTFTVQAGEKKALRYEMTPEAAEPTPPASTDPPPGFPPPVHSQGVGAPFWAAGGVALAGIATFAIAGSLASNAQKSYANAPNDAQAADERSRGITLAAVADVGLVIAIISAGVATYFAIRASDSR